jgi:hypothetical protein
VRPWRKGLAALFAGALTAGISLAAGAGAAAAGTGGVPWTDPHQNGWITSGSITSQPFVWKTVSSAAAPAKYTRGDATLYAYQPIRYEDPGFWTGFQLNGAAFFSNPKHPATGSTVQDQPLAAFTSGYPLHWQGLLQLRMIYTAVGRGADNLTYPAAVLRVSGNRWTLVKGGTTPCTASASLSTEPSVLGHKHHKWGLGGYQGDTKGHKESNVADPSSSPSSRPSGSSSSAPANGQSLAASTTSDSSSGGGSDLAIGLGVLAVLMVIGIGTMIWRRAAR